MTATTTPRTPERTASDGPTSSFAGTGALVRFLLRRDRVRLPAWAGGFGLFIVYLATALPTVAETEEELRGTTQLFADPVGRLLTGPGYGFDAPTYERMIANGYGLYLLLLAALMSILLVSRHTRVEEQTGRAELVRANVVGRYAPLAAALVVAVVTNLAVGVAVFATMVGVGGFAATGSLLLAASIVAMGVAFAGLTSVTVQLSQYSRAASGMAGAVLGAAFLLRAGGDMAAQGGTALSWASPLGWAQQTAPFVLDRWWPLLPLLALAGVGAAAGFALSSRRDVGASLYAERPGPSRARPSLGTPLGLALRLQRASIIGWTSALAVTGMAYGAYADALIQAVDDMPEAFLEIFGAEDMLAGYLAYMAGFMGFLTGVYVILAVHSLRNEESGGRAEPVLATRTSRWAWVGSTLVVLAGAALVMMGVAGAATGIGAALVTGDGGHVVDVTLAHLNMAPAVWVILGLAVLLYGLVPRALPAVWAVIGYAFFIGNFGPMLDLPRAAYDLSPFEHPAEMPLEPFAFGPFAVLVLIAAAAVAVGMVAFRRRDVESV